MQSTIFHLVSYQSNNPYSLKTQIGKHNLQVAVITSYSYNQCLCCHASSTVELPFPLPILKWKKPQRTAESKVAANLCCVTMRDIWNRAGCVEEIDMEQTPLNTISLGLTCLLSGFKELYRYRNCFLICCPLIQRYTIVQEVQALRTNKIQV